MLALSCLAALSFSVVGLPFHLAARTFGLNQFRAKGFLRPPSGLGWLPFLFQRHYTFFEDWRVRWFFAVSHYCLLGLVFSGTATLLLLGCEFLLEPTPSP